MAITNGYATLNDVKAAFRITDDVDDTLLELSIEAASREIDGWCERVFYNAGTATRIYTPTTSFYTEIDDLIQLNTLKTSTTGESFDNTWSDAGDYQLEPLNGKLGGQNWPFTRVRAIQSREWPFDYGQALVEVTARWGWANPAASDDYLPHPVEQAAQIQGVSIFKSADAPLGIAGFGDIGIMRLRQAMHPVAAALLAPYRRDSVQVA